MPSRAQADRYKALLASNAVSKQASDNAVAAVALARLKIDTGGRPLLRTVRNAGYRLTADESAVPPVPANLAPAVVGASVGAPALMNINLMRW